jgi:hypothetical protein
MRPFLFKTVFTSEFYFLICLAPSPFAGPISVSPGPHTHCGVVSSGLSLCRRRRARNKKSSLSNLGLAAIKTDATPAVRHIYDLHAPKPNRRIGLAAQAARAAAFEISCEKKQVIKKTATGQEKKVARSEPVGLAALVVLRRRSHVLQLGKDGVLLDEDDSE